MDPPATSTLQRKMTSMLICRQETMDVELKADSYGFGFALQSEFELEQSEDTASGLSYGCPQEFITKE